MTTPKFDELIHPSTRLSLVALLAAADWVEFSFLRDELALSDSALSKQVATLAEAGYLTVDRDARGQRRRLRVRLTDVGRAAFESHVAALGDIIARAVPPARDAADGRTPTAGAPSTEPA